MTNSTSSPACDSDSSTAAAIRKARMDPCHFVRYLLMDPAGLRDPLPGIHRGMQNHLSAHRLALVELPRDHGKTTQVCLRVLLGRGPFDSAIRSYYRPAPRFGTLPPLTADRLRRRAAMLIGQTIGPFHIEKELGSGAMGTDYRGRFDNKAGSPTSRSKSSPSACSATMAAEWSSCRAPLG